MNAKLIVGKLTEEETLELVLEAVPHLKEESAFMVLDALVENQIDRQEAIEHLKATNED